MARARDGANEGEAEMTRLEEEWVGEDDEKVVFFCWRCWQGKKEERENLGRKVSFFGGNFVNFFCKEFMI